MKTFFSTNDATEGTATVSVDTIKLVHDQTGLRLSDLFFTTEPQEALRFNPAAEPAEVSP